LRNNTQQKKIVGTKGKKSNQNKKIIETIGVYVDSSKRKDLNRRKTNT
jgi:hypothetical protein